jgi:hypothetical protein
VELIRPDEVRRFKRAKARQRWERRRKHVSNRVATRVGGYLPASTKRRLRNLLDFLRSPTVRK